MLVDDTDTVTVLAEGFTDPVDVAVDGDVVYVSDAAGSVFRVGDDVPVATDLAAPQGIAVLDGVVYVVETGTRRVLAVDPATGSGAWWPRTSRSARSTGSGPRCSRTAYPACRARSPAWPPRTVPCSWRPRHRPQT